MQAEGLITQQQQKQQQQAAQTERTTMDTLVVSPIRPQDTSSTQVLEPQSIEEVNQ